MIRQYLRHQRRFAASAAFVAAVVVVLAIGCSTETTPNVSGMHEPGTAPAEYVPTTAHQPEPNTPTPPAIPDRASITSAVDAPPPLSIANDLEACVSNAVAGPRPTGPASEAETATFLRRLQCINGGSPVPAVDGIAVADYVCSEVLPNSPGDLDAATERMESVANGPTPAGFTRATVRAAGAFRCPHLL